MAATFTLIRNLADSNGDIETQVYGGRHTRAVDIAKTPLSYSTVVNDCDIAVLAGLAKTPILTGQLDSTRRRHAYLTLPSDDTGVAEYKGRGRGWAFESSLGKKYCWKHAFFSNAITLKNSNGDKIATYEANCVISTLDGYLTLHKAVDEEVLVLILLTSRLERVIMEEKEAGRRNGDRMAAGGMFGAETTC
ncbi:hypothetical protein GQ54DRAFT_305023 [Martensiomyces pterosporus]|nr:hypothetical protein GQ54DRAFT_305023 [Martensiomyces pterosporus]